MIDPTDPKRIREEYDRTAASYDEAFAADPNTARRFERIDAAQIAYAGERSLEIGCGNGRLLGKLASTPIGVDLSGALLSQAKASGFTVAQADAHYLPFPSGHFDSVLAGNAVYLHLRYAVVLAEAWRVLRSGGRLVVEQLPRRRGGVTHDNGVRAVSEIVKPAEAAGFRHCRTYRWRATRFAPYVVRVAAIPGIRLWDRITVVFQKS